MSGTPVSRSAAAVRRTAASAKRGNSLGASSPAQDSNSISACAPASACARRYSAIASARCASSRSRGLRLRIQVSARGGELLRRPAADEIAEERERGAGETDERHAARRRHAPGGPFPARTARRAPAPGVAAHRSAHRCGSVRARSARLKLQSDPHALQRGHDVAEEDRGVELEAAQRLQRHFRRQLRCARQRDERPCARSSRYSGR